MRLIRQAFVLATLTLASGGASAQTERVEAYPSRAITIVVTAAPGGVSDVVARALAQKLGESWGRDVIVENRGGAAHASGAVQVARAAPDGYTLLVAESGTFTINPVIYPKGKLPYDEARDFTPITGLVLINHSLVASKASGIKSIADLIALAKSKPGTLTYGTSGIGSSPHVNMVMLQKMSGTQLVAVHYRGAAPGLSDVIAGHIDLMSLSTSLVRGPAADGQLVILGVGSAKRLELAPEIPTIAEGGLPGFQATSWFGLFGPANLPGPILSKLNESARRIFTDPELQARFMKPQLFQAIVDTPENFVAFIRADIERWAPVLREANIRVE